MEKILDKQMREMKVCVYLALHQHGDVHKHVMQFLYAALQTHNVFVTRFNLTQCLFRDPRIHDLQHKQQFYQDAV